MIANQVRASLAYRCSVVIAVVRVALVVIGIGFSFPVWLGKERRRQAIESVVHELCIVSVRVRLRSDVPLGVFLSGGLDSSVVAYEAAKVVGPDLRTFTVAMPDHRLDESQFR